MGTDKVYIDLDFETSWIKKNTASESNAGRKKLFKQFKQISRI